MTESVPPPSLAIFLTEEQILQRYAGADDTTLERFWAEVRTRGTPLVIHTAIE